jgi:putative membrane-bound dehydrogenase-like protein
MAVHHGGFSMPVKHTLIIALTAVLSLAAAPLNRTPAPGEYQTPTQTAANFKVPEGFEVTVFAGEPDLVQPIAFCFDQRGRLFVVENFSYPNWKATGKDRIVILEDTNGDGKFNTKKLFWDKGNFISGIQVGHGGVWVGTPPHLLFIPDKDHDDKPDSEPVKLLDGWGHHDTHETINSMAWGPDGWLYGCQGVFTQSKVGKPGTPDDKRTPFNAGIWRYHPKNHTFEVFAEGGSNQWGVDFNEHGQSFMTACVIPHLYHVIQGGHYRRQAGQHFNKHVYKDIDTIRSHTHYAAAFAGAMCYLGDQFPPSYRNQLFFNNIHASKVHIDRLVRKGSGFEGRLGPHDIEIKSGRKIADYDSRGTGFVNSSDKWVRGLALRSGPDGSVYLSDWYDKRPCHQLRPHDQDLKDKTGRLYKITYTKNGEPKPLGQFDVANLQANELVKLLTHKNDWWSRMARRVLHERGNNTKLAEQLFDAAVATKDQPKALRYLWAMHAAGGTTDDRVYRLLDHPGEYVRAWAIQLELEDGKVSDRNVTRMATLAKNDTSLVVRLYLASACQRMTKEKRWGVLEQLIQHESDGKDQNLPQMYWYAIEPLVADDKIRALKLAAKTKIQFLRQSIARRAASK